MTDSASPHWLTNKHIIISGLGISGCCFAVSLYHACQHHQITPPKISIYERDAELDTNFYSIGIRSDSASGGIQVLQALNLFDIAAQQHHIPDGKNFSILDGNGNHIFTKQATPLTENMRLSRHALRKILMDALPASVDIHWSSGIIGVERHDDETVKCILADGRVAECDIVVAADGSMSKVRQSIRPDLTPQYNGVIFLFCRTIPGTKLLPPFNDTWGMSVPGDGNFLFVTAPDHDTTLFALGWKAPRTSNTFRPGEATEQQVDDAIEEMKQHGTHLGPAFQHMIDCVDRKSVWRRNTYEMMPWENTGNVICIGDANHGMSPTAGNGANMALMDGYELAGQMVNCGDLKHALIEYNKQAMPRSASSIKVSRICVYIVTATGLVHSAIFTLGRFVGWLFGARPKHANIAK